jgi:hypothetical protein
MGEKSYFRLEDSTEIESGQVGKTNFNLCQRKSQRDGDNLLIYILQIPNREWDGLDM